MSFEIESATSNGASANSEKANLERTVRGEIRPMLNLALPLALGELGWMAMTLVDTVMVGRMHNSALAIGGTALGQGIFYTVSICAGGLLLGLDTLVAQAYGRGDIEDANHSVVQAAYLGMALLPLMMLTAFLGPAMLRVWGLDADLVEVSREFLNALAWSSAPLLAYFILRRYLQALNHVRPIMFALITANLVNLAGNWVLIYGHLGAPAMGVAGSAWATGLARLYMAGVLGVSLLYFQKRDDLRWAQTWAQHGLRLDFSRIRRLLQLGGPAGAQIFLEIAAFAAAAVLAGKLGAVPLSAHQIALNCAAFSFMVPLGVSSAAAVRVGQSIGRQDWRGARIAGRAAILLGCGFMAVAAAVFLLIPRPLAHIFSPDPAVIASGARLLWIAAAFQLFDGLQTVMTGALRGAGNTRVAMIANLTGYWLLGLPVGWWLCFRRGMGVEGLWIGLCLGLIAIGVWLFVVWERLQLLHSRLPA